MVGPITATLFLGLLALAAPMSGASTQQQSGFQGPRMGSLQVGDRAVDFDLKMVGAEGSFKLSSNFGKKPTLLIFGSYT